MITSYEWQYYDSKNVKLQLDKNLMMQLNLTTYFSCFSTELYCIKQFTQLGGKLIFKLSMTSSFKQVFHNTFKQQGDVPLNLTCEYSLTSHVTEHNTQYKAA